MFLRSLSIKGFKSFADPVSMDLSPGVSVIVGPNGSGKSNIVDAIAWVLGAQGPKTVRSSKMDDVIFAGAGKRGPLGRAEVSIVIDNSDRRLGIDLSEITVSRTLFRNGESEYALNGNPCRLIDLQELLSDAGVGRQQHVIISQGQLDLVLNARAEERRVVVEEAAGITKFKKRRERTERRLDAMEGDLNRAGDLVREVKRQMRPLAQQAAKAKRQLELRDRVVLLKRYLAGAEYRSLEIQARAAASEKVDAEAFLQKAQIEKATLDDLIKTLESEQLEVSTERLVEVIASFDTLCERLRSVADLATQRKLVAEEKIRDSDRSSAVESLSSEKKSLMDELIQVEADIVALGPDLERLEGEEVECRSEEDGGLEEQLERATSQFNALSSEKGQALSRQGALSDALESVDKQRYTLSERRQRVAVSLEAKEAELRGVIARLDDLAARLTEKSELHKSQSELDSALRASLDDADRHYAELQLKLGTVEAKVTAYEAAIEEGRSKTQVSALGDVPGTLGALVDLIEVEEGYEAAFSASVRGFADSVLLSTREPAISALRRLKQLNLEGSVVSVAGFNPPGELENEVSGGNLRPVRSVVRALSPQLSGFLDAVLSECYVVITSLDEAIEMHLRHSGATFVTLGGERLAPDGLRTASSPMRATRAALDRALSERNDLLVLSSAAKSEVENLREKSVESSEAVKQMARELDSLTHEIAGLEALPQRLETEIASARGDLDELDREYHALSARKGELEAELESLGPLAASLVERSAELGKEVLELQERRKSQFNKRRELDLRRSELELKAARLEQRRIGLERTLGSIESRLEGEIKVYESLRWEISELECSAIGFGEVAKWASLMHAQALEAATEAKNRRSTLNAQAQKRLDSLMQARDARRRCEGAIDERRDALQLCSIRASETRVRLETMAERIRRELGIETDIAVATPIPEGIHPNEAEHVLAVLEDEFGSLGAVNELAEYELAELAERSRFLEAQLEDVKGSRRELIKVIRAIDSEMLNVFQSAFSDVAQNFTVLFEKLFPGGKGRLFLTDPEHPLESGLEIEVTLPGKSVRKLSLLSGGERSLVALAFLFSIFESRPSPFFILDEVEAALDDINLNRFLRLITSFGRYSQLLVISHQKRTMEVADLLYGVTMQEGGSTKIVAQNMSRILAGT